MKELREKVQDYCTATKCSSCVLEGQDWEHKQMLREQECLLIHKASDEELEKAISLIERERVGKEIDEFKRAVKDESIIRHPSHYCYSKYEPKDVIRAWGLNFNLGSTVKYIARAGRKDDIIQDLRKAKQFLEFEIEALEAEHEH